MSRKLRLTSEETVFDLESRYLMVKGLVGTQHFKFATQHKPDPVFRTFSPLVGRDGEGFPYTWGGDINCSLDPCQDTSRGISSMSFAAQRHLKSLLHSHMLIDAWRILHPKDIDYTFYSTVRKSYSRIDFFFLTHRLLYLMLFTDILILLLFWTMR